MPELPEVESLTRGLRGPLLGAQIIEAEFLRKNLRLPLVPGDFKKFLKDSPITEVTRRSKYLLLKSQKGAAIIHLGMTGILLRKDQKSPEFPHTHVVFKVAAAGGEVFYLHYVDPRRFGLIVFCSLEELQNHKLLKNLGPEPLESKNLGEHLFLKSRKKSQPIKTFLMDAHHVVGVGNIYASEALFSAGINPEAKAGSINKDRYESLGQSVQEILARAIKAGGTTFRDFQNADGKPGYFAVSLNVYDRAGEPCPKCSSKIRLVRQGGRSTYFCPLCQK